MYYANGNNAARFQFRFTQNEQDYFEFNRFHAYNMPRLKRRIHFMRVLCAVIMLMFGIITVLRQGSTASLVTFGAFFVAAAYCYISFPKAYDRSIRKNIKRTKKDGSVIYSKEIEMVFEDDAFHEKTADSASTVRYSALERVGVGAYGVYLYTSAVTAHIIPASAFAGQAVWDAFVAFIQAKVPVK